MYIFQFDLQLVLSMPSVEDPPALLIGNFVVFLSLQRKSLSKPNKALLCEKVIIAHWRKIFFFFFKSNVCVGMYMGLEMQVWGGCGGVWGCVYVCVGGCGVGVGECVYVCLRICMVPYMHLKHKYYFGIQ